MFLFNKNNAAPRRQSSIDSLVIEPSASTSPSTSEAGLSHYSDASSHGDMPSPEQPEHPYLRKRSSVFKLRSRSNTTTSTASSVSVSASMLNADGSHRTSQDLRHLSGQNFFDFSGAKRSRFTRGKRGKRLSAAVSPNPEIEEVEEEDGGSKRVSVLRKMRRNTNQSETSPHQVKHQISSPFDFQHLTHTDRDQFGSLEEHSEHNLVAEYWAARTGQSPSGEVNGIKTGEHSFINSSSENLTNVNSRSTSRSVLSFNSPPQSPAPSRGEHRQPESPESCRGTIRPSRSVESFSQPSIHSRLHRHTQSATSRQQLAHIEDSPEDSSHARRLPRTRSNRDSGVWDQFFPAVTPPLEKLPTIADEQEYFGHAVSTPDDSAIHPMSPVFTPGLEDVAEEPERFISPRPAPAPPTGSPMRSPLREAFSPRTIQRTRVNSRGSSFASPIKPPTRRTSITRPMSQMSDTLGSPTFPRRNSFQRPAEVRRRSNTWRVIEESWEDDVDYIYENAIEAECDFDWERASDDGVYEDRDRTPEQEDHQSLSAPVTQRVRSQSFISEDEPTLPESFFQRGFRPSLLVPSHLHVPELGSAISASTADTVRTPSEFFGSLGAPYAEGEGFILSPSLLVPQEYKESAHDDTYSGILSDYEGSDRHVPIIDANQSVSSSARNSNIRSSKHSSYDSSLMSSGQGSGLWDSPIRRSASSSGSIPELVHSRRSRKDFNIVVDRLSEQVASFGSLGEDDIEEKEDDDTTPPGRAPQNLTFFTEDEEDHPAHRSQSSVEVELKTSLELARNGSVRSSSLRAPHHRHVASDGAAKLLASPTSTPELKAPPKKAKRARASSSPFLSLFPTPPKHTPINSPITPNYPKNL